VPDKQRHHGWAGEQGGAEGGSVLTTDAAVTAEEDRSWPLERQVSFPGAGQNCNVF